MCQWDPKFLRTMLSSRRIPRLLPIHSLSITPATNCRFFQFQSVNLVYILITCFIFCLFNLFRYIFIVHLFMVDRENWRSRRCCQWCARLRSHFLRNFLFLRNSKLVDNLYYWLYVTIVNNKVFFLFSLINVLYEIVSWMSERLHGKWFELWPKKQNAKLPWLLFSEDSLKWNICKK